MKFILDHIILFGIAAVSGAALLWPALQMRGKTASPLEVTQMINRGKNVLLDVREAAEFAKESIRDSKNIPLGDLPNRIAELDKSKAKTVIVICQSGARSAKVTAILQKAGFNDVVSLAGGLAAWQAAGLPIAK